MLLANRVAIINGGAIGMGRSMALKFAEEGCSSVIADINETEGKKTVEEVSKKGRECLFVKCDITDIRQIKPMVDQAIGKFGKVDILVNNAGGVPRPQESTPLKEGERPRMGIAYTDEEYWDKMLALNLKGHVFCCKEVAPYMIKQKFGKIISISTMGVFAPPAPSVEYHSAKAGVLGMTYNLAFELAPYGINVNAILPGPVRTAFWDPVTAGVTDKDAYFAEIGKTVPLQRVGTPEDIANAALFLASELSSFITGAAIPVAGGIPLSPYHELY
ncbi:3-oxoacyl-[acyl-carrier-protein] reductase FabG [subsurface metagenome]